MPKDWIGNYNSVFKTLGSSHHSDHDRQPYDYYATEPRAAQLLLEVEQFHHNIWEPACGELHLAKYEYTEQMAYELCEKYNLLSPIYQFAQRSGCWFCMNTRYKDFARLKIEHTELWNELLKLGQTKNLCSYGFKYGKTIEQVDKKINAINSQLELQL